MQSNVDNNRILSHSSLVNLPHCFSPFWRSRGLSLSLFLFPSQKWRRGPEAISMQIVTPQEIASVFTRRTFNELNAKKRKIISCIRRFQFSTISITLLFTEVVVECLIFGVKAVKKRNWVFSFRPPPTFPFFPGEKSGKLAIPTFSFATDCGNCVRSGGRLIAETNLESLIEERKKLLFGFPSEIWVPQFRSFPNKKHLSSEINVLWIAFSNTFFLGIGVLTQHRISTWNWWWQLVKP